MVTEIASIEPSGLMGLLDQSGLVLAPGSYQHYRYFSADELDLVARGELLKEAASAVSCFGVFEAGKLSAFCLLFPLEWDSRYFGRKIYRAVFHGLKKVSVAAAASIIDKVLADTVSRFAAEHVSCEVSMDDYDVTNAFLSAGFRLVDTKRTFVARQGLKFSHEKSYGFSVREYEGSDREAVMGIFSSQRFDSRYTRDAFFDGMKAREMYAVWAAGLIEKDDSKRVFKIAERDGELVAAGGIVEIGLQESGVAKTIMGGGVFAATAKGTGAYMTVLRALIETGWGRGYGLLETKVSINNLAACRVLEKMGATSAASHYVLHYSRPDSVGVNKE